MTIPKRSDQQKAVARTKCSRLCQKFKYRKPIIDDESYFTLNHSSINGNDIFYTSDVKSTPFTVEYQTKRKFQKKSYGFLFLKMAFLSPILCLVAVN